MLVRWRGLYYRTPWLIRIKFIDMLYQLRLLSILSQDILYTIVHRNFLWLTLIVMNIFLVQDSQLASSPWLLITSHKRQDFCSESVLMFNQQFVDADDQVENSLPVVKSVGNPDAEVFSSSLVKGNFDTLNFIFFKFNYLLVDYHKL